MLPGLFSRIIKESLYSTRSIGYLMFISKALKHRGNRKMFEVWGVYEDQANEVECVTDSSDAWTGGKFRSFAKARDCMVAQCIRGHAGGRRIGAIFVQRGEEVREYQPFVFDFAALPEVPFDGEWPLLSKQRPYQLGR
jgi:hypothetical protein